ncbi:hypothetical protein CRUP_022706 [Coryphaenoides rupestris]|nr:hypothetical protein CRUP_022706 [Coryphaenoides rupestris]
MVPMLVKTTEVSMLVKWVWSWGRIALLYTSSDLILLNMMLPPSGGAEPVSLILSIAANWLVQEKKDLIAAKQAYISEICPAADLSGDQATLMVHALVH